jgi:GNAT superfamily N-acetyltransferase
MNLDYRIENLGYHHGQTDMELGLYDDDSNEIIGMVQYTLYDGELSVKDIIVRPEYRRKGLASRMMQYLKKHHSDHKYIPSMKTDLGAKFKHKEIEGDLRKYNETKMSKRKYILTLEAFKASKNKINESDEAKKNVERSIDVLAKFGMEEPIRKYMTRLSNTNDLWEYDKLTMELEEDEDVYLGGNPGSGSASPYTKFHRDFVPKWAREKWNSGEMEFAGMNLKKLLFDDVEPQLKKYMEEKGLYSELAMVAYEVGSNGPDDTYYPVGTFKMGYNVWKENEEGEDEQGICYFEFNIPNYGGFGQASFNEKEDWSPDGHSRLEHEDFKVGVGCVMGKGNFIKNDFSHPGSDLVDWLGDGGVILLEK